MDTAAANAADATMALGPEADETANATAGAEATGAADASMASGTNATETASAPAVDEEPLPLVGQDRATRSVLIPQVLAS